MGRFGENLLSRKRKVERALADEDCLVMEWKTVMEKFKCERGIQFPLPTITGVKYAYSVFTQ